METPDVDPTLTHPDLSCRVIAAVIRELDAAMEPKVVDTVLEGIGMPRAFVEAPEHWVSTTFVRRFVAGVAKTAYGLDASPPHDHPMWQHWRRAALHALRPEVIGPIHRVLRAVGSPSNFYTQVPELQRRATRTRESELLSVAEDRAVLALRPVADGGSMESQNCWFQYGTFEAVPTLWGLPPAKIEHRACMLDPHHPADACIYEITFEAPQRGIDTALLGWTTGGAALGSILAAAVGTSWAVGAAMGALAGLAWEGWRRHRRATRFARADVDTMNRLLERADERQSELWEEHVALRRSMLVARKLSGYLASDLTERILQHPELQLDLGGRHTDAAVLFADIVGFTPRCERMDPERLVEELNVYFGHVDPCIDRHGGVIDKRIGDGVMAVFVPREGDEGDVAVRAIRSAMDMLRALEACNAHLAERGAQPFQIRVGAAVGELVQGNMGSPIRLEYTVIGDVVNLAARLETAARPDSALLPRSMLDRLDPAERADLSIGAPRSVAVKGRTGTFEVVDVQPLHSKRPS